jgi:hypothetical protein
MALCQIVSIFIKGALSGIVRAINENLRCINIMAIYRLIGFKLGTDSVADCHHRVNLCLVIYAINTKAK